MAVKGGSCLLVVFRIEQILSSAAVTFAELDCGQSDVIQFFFFYTDPTRKSYSLEIAY